MKSFFHQKRINNPGIPRKVEKIKKFDHPKDSTIKPEGEDKTVLAIPIIDDKSAYCVPLKLTIMLTIRNKSS